MPNTMKNLPASGMPMLVIKKKSGKWRLLHDLHAVSTQMEIIGSVQLGLPMTSSLAINWTLMVIDLIDCFFTSPLHPTDDKFASTLPSINHSAPDLRYEWVVLPQGMENSPTLCQLYVDKALRPILQQYPRVYLYHYMDDILIC